MLAYRFDEQTDGWIYDPDRSTLADVAEESRSASDPALKHCKFVITNYCYSPDPNQPQPSPPKIRDIEWCPAWHVYVQQ